MRGTDRRIWLLLAVGGLGGAEQSWTVEAVDRAGLLKPGEALVFSEREGVHLHADRNDRKPLRVVVAGPVVFCIT